MVLRLFLTWCGLLLAASQSLGAEVAQSERCLVNVKRAASAVASLGRSEKPRFESAVKTATGGSDIWKVIYTYRSAPLAYEVSVFPDDCVIDSVGLSHP